MKIEQRNFIILLIGLFFMLTPAYILIAFYIYNSVPNTNPNALNLNMQNNHNEIKLSLMIIGVSISFLAFVAMHYLRNYFGQQKANVIDVYDNNIGFSRKRRDIVKKLNKNDVYDVYCTSHCNLFSDICDIEEDREKLKKINTEFFENLATLTKNSSACINLLIYYDDEKELHEELYERIKIMNSCNTTWGVDSFSVKALKNKSQKDYLVIGNMVFKTIRKTEKSYGGTKFVFVKGHSIATIYREWLKDVFQNGGEGEYLKNSRESEALNSLVQKIKNDPDNFARENDLL